MTLHFTDITPSTPEIRAVAAEYAALALQVEAASSPTELQTAIQAWDALRRRLDTWINLVDLRFNQDTRDPECKAALEAKDQMTPKLTELANNMKQQLLAHPLRKDMERVFGPQAFALWETDVLAYSPAIEADKIQESKLESDYIELLASATFHYQGETYTLSALAKFREHPDRQVREETERLRWDWYHQHRETLDGIYDALVKLRTGMARKLGFEDYREMGYKRMKRIDYGREDVERFRNEVLEHVVPVCLELRRRQAQTLGLDALRYWDELFYDPAGNPAPKGDHDWMMDRAQEMFDHTSPALGGFFRLMTESGLMDLKGREGKAGGGFCTDFPTHGLPYIFANFNGTMGDAEVFTHEMGHAFQGYQSRHQPLVDYLWPTLESCEIHSMSLEFLTWPQMERFFENDADRYRQVHLTRMFGSIPYMVAVDHFQHLVYAQPEATPEARHAMWKELEQRYLPWRNHGDIAYTAKGGTWQQQRHIYGMPFYYIDYALAATCAMQFWVRSEDNPAQAMQDYEALCTQGGSMAFQALVASAGLVSPFQRGSLATIAAQVRQSLGVS